MTEVLVGIASYPRSCGVSDIEDGLKNSRRMTQRRQEDREEASLFSNEVHYARGESLGAL